MKVLMFGWEFPPHISGGLGTACYGLTKGLAKLNSVDIVFVVPKAFGDEDESVVELIGANQIPIAQKEIQFENEQQKIDYYEIESNLVPYVSEDEFWKLKSKKYTKSTHFIKADENSKIEFSGKYGPNLMQEIWNYSFVAEKIVKENEFDVIHAHDWLTFPAAIAAKKVAQL